MPSRTGKGGRYDVVNGSIRLSAPRAAGLWPRQSERTIEIDLARRQHALEARVLAEAKLGGAGEADGPLFRAVLIFELLEQRLLAAPP
jgi:hypothetical protein